MYWVPPLFMLHPTHKYTNTQTKEKCNNLLAGGQNNSGITLNKDLHLLPPADDSPSLISWFEPKGLIVTMATVFLSAAEVRDDCKTLKHATKRAELVGWADPSRFAANAPAHYLRPPSGSASLGAWPVEFFPDWSNSDCIFTGRVCCCLSVVTARLLWWLSACLFVCCPLIGWGGEWE